MAYTSTPYCTLADVKALLKLPNSDSVDDAFISALMQEAQEAIDDFIGHSYQTDGTTQTPATRVFDGYGGDKLVVGDFQSVTQVLENSYGYFVGTNGVEEVTVGQVDITADCMFGPYDRGARGLPYTWLKRKSALEFIPGTANYQLTGVFGNPNVPASISHACARISAHWYLMRNTQFADVVTSKDGTHTRYNKPLPPDVVELLNFHKRRHFLAR